MTGIGWAELAQIEPELTAAGQRLLSVDDGPLQAFLATTAPDGGPRLHPVFPVLADGELWLFIVNLSPKYRDLVRNGRFALHSLPPLSIPAQQGGSLFVRVAWVGASQRFD